MQDNQIQGFTDKYDREKQFGVFPVTYHTHNGTDSTPIDSRDIQRLYYTIQDKQNQLSAANYAVSHTVYLQDTVSGWYNIMACSVVFGTTSSSGTLQVEVASGTQAVGSGTNQLRSTVSLSGTANVVVNGTVINKPTVIKAGSRINLIFAGTVTGLANCCVSLCLKRVG